MAPAVRRWTSIFVSLWLFALVAPIVPAQSIRLHDGDNFDETLPFSGASDWQLSSSDADACDTLFPELTDCRYGSCQSEMSLQDWLQLDVCLSGALLDFQNRQTDKEILILADGAKRSGRSPLVIVGGQSRLSFLAATTNTANKFPYLGRFPTDFHGDTATDARMLHANAHATARMCLPTPACMENCYSRMSIRSVPGPSTRVWISTESPWLANT